MGAWETKPDRSRLGFVIEVVIARDIANAVLAMARTSMMHADFPGRLCKGSQHGIPVGPSDIEMVRSTALTSSTCWH